MTTLGPYTLVRRLATGGMADIFLAERDGDTFVVKRILPHLCHVPEVIEMFLAEAELAHVLDHPRIARIYEAGEEHGAYYLAMEYVDGKDLQSILEARPKPVPAVVSVGLVAAVADALHHVHERGYVHRDVSPSNVMIARQGTVKLLDFGIAAAGKGHVEDGALKGKYAYMAPEQVKGLPVDRRADLFCLGIVLHELLTGRRLFQRENQLATLHAVNEAEIPAVSGVPSRLASLVARLLSRDPDDRPRDAAEVRAELLALLAAEQFDEARVERHVARFLRHVFPEPEAQAEPESVPALAPVPASVSVPAPARQHNLPLYVTAGVLAVVVLVWLLA